MLKIYNSLAKCKQNFVPLTANKVKLYVCGMTVYDYCHLGHARVMVVFDMIVRWFRESGYEVVPGGVSKYGKCEQDFGKTSIYQCSFIFS